MSYGSSFQQRLFYAAPGFVKNLAATFHGSREKKLRHGSSYAAHYQRADELQWRQDYHLSPDYLTVVQSFLQDAVSTSPYYKNLFEEAGFVVACINSIRDLEALPLLTKEAFRSNMDRIVSVDSQDKNLHWVHTSGTTGLGLRFPETKECFQREYAYRYHNYAQGGISVADRWAFCAGHPVAEANETKPPFWVYDRSNAWLLMSSVHLTENNLVSYIRELERFKPALLGGYPSSVYMLALANEFLGRPVRLKAIYTASETLFDFQRSVIEASFGCRARSYYGNAERCGFAAECEHGTFHFKQEHSYMEVLDDANAPSRPGQIGRLVGTGLGNRATPLIRYDVGDLAVVSLKERCECGRGGLLLDSIVGRTEDYIVTPDSRFVGRLDHLFKDAKHVRMAQLYQETPAVLEIRIVKAPGYTSEDEAEILKEARRRLGDSIKIAFAYVDDVQRTATGKFRFVLSKVASKQAFGTVLPSIPE